MDTKRAAVGAVMKPARKTVPIEQPIPALVPSDRDSAPPADPLIVETFKGESSRSAHTRLAMRPTVQAAISLTECRGGWGRSLFDQKDLPNVVKELSAQVAAVGKGDLSRAESMLVCHAHVLDGMFHDLAQRARLNIAEYPDAFERYMRLALKAQAQCRVTIEALAEIKNPRPVAFVRQANIAAGPQQINNGETSRAREIPKNELLEVTHGNRLDFGATSEAINGDSRLASVEQLDGTAVSRGEVPSEPEQREARSVQPGDQAHAAGAFARRRVRAMT